MRPGIYHDIPNAEYHASPGASSTALKKLRQSPAHYRAYMAEQRKETDALRFGQLIHTAVLEPEKFDSTVAVGPDCAKNRKEWKEFAAEHEGMDLIKKSEAETIMAMVEQVHSHPKAKALLVPGAGQAEVSAYWTDERSGEFGKCRPDFWRHDGIIIDYKSTTDASPEAFAKAIWNYGYHISAGHYLDGCAAAIRQSGADIVEPTSFVFIAQEKEPPYAVGVYLADYEMIQVGKMIANDLMVKLSECKAANYWPAYSELIEEISLPRWAAKKEAA
jgi:exodeoxyribonuclease VIII